MGKRRRFSLLKPPERHTTVTTSVLQSPSHYLVTTSVLQSPSHYLVTTSVLQSPSHYLVTTSVLQSPSHYLVTTSVLQSPLKKEINCKRGAKQAPEFGTLVSQILKKSLFRGHVLYHQGEVDPPPPCR